MNHEEPDEHGIEIFYRGFRDKAEAFSRARGSQTTSWDDLLAVAATHPSTVAILRDQGVSASSLGQDLYYTMYFGRPVNGLSTSLSGSYSSLYQDAAQSLLGDIKAYQQQHDYTRQPGSGRIASQFISIIQEHLESRGKMMRNPNAIKEVEIKARLLHDALEGFVVEMIGTDESEELKNDPQKLLQLYMNGDSSDSFIQFTQRRLKLAILPDQPLKVLDALNHNSQETITPFQLVEILKGQPDPFVEYLLYRNGLLAPEGYVAPIKMPHAVTVEHALEALHLVQSTRGVDVNTEHLLPSLLYDREVVGIIMDLDKDGALSEKNEPDPFAEMFGGSSSRRRNLIKFNNAVRRAITPEEEGERFRHQPVIAVELKNFLQDVNKTVATGPEDLASARMLGELLKDARIRGILAKAGLSREHMKKWPAALKEAAAKKELEKKKDGNKDKKEFKIDDYQLNTLLGEYTVDLTQFAKEGKLDPIVGREQELKQMITILLQKGRSNPLLIGEPGVGKTALFDGLAQLIASGDVPKQLIGAKVLLVNLNDMNSGAMYRGQFEGRLLPLIQGVAERNLKGDVPPYILCIDEVHSALQAGTASNTPGAGELLKPYLTRGELSIVGATTQADYAKHIATDHALDRRFQSVSILEPSATDSVAIVAGLKELYTAHHGIEIANDLIPMIVALSNRYLPNLHQPDKALQVFDAAFARARMMGRNEVTRDVIIDTIAAAAKIEAEFLQESEGDRYLKLREQLPQQVLGQDQAILEIASTLIIAKAGLQDPRRPLGKFLLLGSTGVGKTETARALARLLHGTEDALIRIDMSDYQERHEASKLVGAPPGYIGYGEEGVLTGAVRRRPYSVIVLDEIEKAHPEVLRRFLPVFEEGEITDGRGEKINFRNTIILMTSNLGAEKAARVAAHNEADNGNGTEYLWNEVTKPIYEEAVKNHLPPEFLNRLDGRLVYRPLPPEIIEQLVEREIEDISSRTVTRWNAPIQITEDVRTQIATEGYSPEYGARQLKRTVQSTVVAPLAAWLLEQNDQQLDNTTIEITGIGEQFHADVVLP